MRTARIYLRVSTNRQDLSRQEALVEQAKSNGFYVAGVYREVGSGTSLKRPELTRLVNDLQPGDLVIAEKIDRISRLPLPAAEKLVAAIESKQAKLFIPGIVDLSGLAGATDGVAKIVIESTQAMLLRIALQIARDDYLNLRQRQSEGIALAKEQGRYTGRRADKSKHNRIIELRKAKLSIAKTAALTNTSPSTVKRVWAAYLSNKTYK